MKSGKLEKMEKWKTWNIEKLENGRFWKNGKMENRMVPYVSVRYDTVLAIIGEPRKLRWLPGPTLFP